jgi:DNA-binding MarR family transcriptional regulator
MNTKEQLQIETVLTTLELDRKEIARQLKLNPSTVSLTLSGKRAAEDTLDAITGVVAASFKGLVKTASEPVTN